MQEIYEKFNSMTDAGFRAWMLNNYSDLLKREKEVIMDAYEAGSHTEWSEDTWMLVEKREYYNETFNDE